MKEVFSSGQTTCRINIFPTGLLKTLLIKRKATDLLETRPGNG